MEHVNKCLTGILFVLYYPREATQHTFTNLSAAPKGIFAKNSVVDFDEFM